MEGSWAVHLLIGLEPIRGSYVTRGLSDAKPAVTFPAVEVISSKLYCLVREAHLCKELSYKVVK